MLVIGQIHLYQPTKVRWSDEHFLPDVCSYFQPMEKVSCDHLVLKSVEEWTGGEGWVEGCSSVRVMGKKKKNGE